MVNSAYTIIPIGFFYFILLPMLIIMTFLNTNYDLRDVNRDGVVNLTDLSVLAVEIQKQ
jgi:hypothetical protein